MKSLLALIIIFKFLYNIRNYELENEKFIYLKCIAYLFISSIHSTIVYFPIPLGALIMFCFCFIDNKNKKVKYRMIGAGMLIIVISLLKFDYIAYPFQKAYLHNITQSVEKIDIYSYVNEHENFLFSITDPSELSHWSNQIELSVPTTEWSNKKLGTNLGYKLIVYSSDNEPVSIKIDPYMRDSPNLFLSDRYIPYINTTIVPYIYSVYSNTPSSLTINTSKSASINIYNTNILNDLWRTILWSHPISTTKLKQEDFKVPSYLFFDKYLGCRLSFTTDFKYAVIDKEKVIQLPPHLQTMLNEQYILSQLDHVNELTHFEPAHVSNPSGTYANYDIQMDPNNMYYGLYLQDYKTNETVLLHTVTSPHAEYFLLKYPYILLLDEKSPDDYYLMLVNQNVPEKHRYILKNAHIIPRSISLCPQNTKFTYIVDQGDTSTLYLVSDYYRSARVVTTGNIQDSLFLSDDYIAFTQLVDQKSILCIYSISNQQVIKYIHIPGDITLTDANDNTITFAVQAIEGLNLKEGIFCIDSHLNIYKKKRP